MGKPNDLRTPTKMDKCLKQIGGGSVGGKGGGGQKFREAQNSFFYAMDKAIQKVVHPASPYFRRNKKFSFANPLNPFSTS